MNEEKKKDVPVTAPTPEAIPEEKPKEIEKPEVTPQDIDFEKELKAIEHNKPSKYTEEEKAIYSLKKNAERVRELGQDPAEILGLKEEEFIPQDEDSIVSKTTRRVMRQQAENQIRSSAKTEAEVRVFLHYYDVLGNYDDAYWQTYKHRTKNALEEMKRNPSIPGNTQGAGQRGQDNQIPVLPPDQAKNLRRAGMKEVKPGVWEGKFMTYYFDSVSKTWISERKKK